MASICGEVTSQISSLDSEYNSLVREVKLGQKQFTSHREVRSSGNDPRWMTDRLKNEKGRKRRLYARIKREEAHLRDRYNELAKTVKKNTCIAKRNYEIRIAREAKSNPKGSFQLYKTKVRDRIGLLKSGESLIDSDEEMSEALNNYFLTIFTKERLDFIPQGEEIFRGEEEELTDVNISREDVIRQTQGYKGTGARSNLS